MQLMKPVPQLLHWNWWMLWLLHKEIIGLYNLHNYNLSTIIDYRATYIYVSSSKIYSTIITTYHFHHYINMIVACQCVCYGRSVETIWLRDTRRCISGSWLKEATIRPSLWVPVKTLATGTNTSSLDRPYKNQAAMDTYMYKPAVS